MIIKLRSSFGYVLVCSRCRTLIARNNVYIKPLARYVAMRNLWPQYCHICGAALVSTNDKGLRTMISSVDRSRNARCGMCGNIVVMLPVLMNNTESDYLYTDVGVSTAGKHFCPKCGGEWKRCDSRLWIMLGEGE